LAMQKASLIFLAVTAVSAVVLVSALGLLAANQAIQNSGSVLKTIGVSVFSDKGCTTPISVINWGTLAPDSSASKTIYVKNNGTAAEVLSMTTSLWNPATASTYIHLNWNCTSYVLTHGSVVAAVLTLNVLPNIVNVTTFNFQITITGTENA
jgi:hypothetical protein